MADLMISDVFVEDTTVDAMFRSLAARVASFKDHRVERPADDTLVIHHRHTPGWAVALAIVGLLFFLLGLLFLLVKTTESATLLGRDVDGGARFTASGRSSDSVANAIQAAIRTPGGASTGPMQQAWAYFDGGHDKLALDQAFQAIQGVPSHAVLSNAASLAISISARTSVNERRMGAQDLTRMVEQKLSSMETPSTLDDPTQPGVSAQEPGAPAPLPTSPSTSASTVSDQVGLLKELADLRERGILSDEEFQAAKARTLGQDDTSGA